MFEKWKIVSGPLGSKFYCRESKEARFKYKEKYTSFINLFCTVRQLNYNVLLNKKNKRLICSWHCTIIGRAKSSGENVLIAESEIFKQEFLAILWAEKYIKERLQCNIEAPLLIPNIGTIG